MDPSFIPYRIAAAYLQDRLKKAGLPLPTLGIICGSGLSGLSKTLQGLTLTIKYSEVPGFPSHTTVKGHTGEIVFGFLSGSVSTICFRGRFHSYEGHDMKTVVLPVNIMRCLQVKFVIVTNASGGLNRSYKVGDVVTVADHFALPHVAGKNSLVGPNDEELGPRFPATSDIYPEEYRRVVQEASQALGFNDFVRTDGACYCFVSGPMFESRAESRFLQSLGGDAVGMSTVPEIIAAHHAGMKVLCLSLITNNVIMEGDDGPAASHAEVLETATMRAMQMQRLVSKIVSLLKEKAFPKLEDLPPVNLKVPSSMLPSTELQKKKPSDKSSTEIVYTLLIFFVGLALGAMFVSEVHR